MNERDEKDPSGTSLSEKGLARVLDDLREGLQIIGLDWRYLYVNDAVCLHGQRERHELLGRTMMEAYPGIEETAMFAVLERVMKDRIPEELENEFDFPNGSKGWFELRIEPVPEGILVLSLDITDRKALEAQLRHSQKMEAIGRLAGGIAHDFNNILTAIQSYGRLVLERLPEEGSLRGDMNEVVLAADRAESLVRQLLAFSRKQIIEPRVLDLDELVAGVDRMLRPILGEDVTVVTRRGKDVWPVLVDPAALEQVLVNLAVNARDAMPGGGRLTIETANTSLDESYSMAKGDVVTPGDYVVLAVTDSGTGMSDDTKQRLFEPFFTTKARGVGTGLGLSTCYGIVKQAGGYIWVYSESGSGTTFKIYLPRTRSDRAEAAADEPEAADLSGTETVLVVEDDDQVRSLVVRMLEQLGYRVFHARSGAEALRPFGETEEPLHLLLTDVVMPETSGRELAEELGARHPDLRVLYMSGYTENAIAHHGVLEKGIHLLEKPFTPDGLARKVRAVLDG